MPEQAKKRVVISFQVYVLSALRGGQRWTIHLLLAAYHMPFRSQAIKSHVFLTATAQRPFCHRSYS